MRYLILFLSLSLASSVTFAKPGWGNPNNDSHWRKGPGKSNQRCNGIYMGNVVNHASALKINVNGRSEIMFYGKWETLRLVSCRRQGKSVRLSFLRPDHNQMYEGELSFGHFGKKTVAGIASNVYQFSFNEVVSERPPKKCGERFVGVVGPNFQSHLDLIKGQVSYNGSLVNRVVQSSCNEGVLEFYRDLGNGNYQYYLGTVEGRGPNRVYRGNYYGYSGSSWFEYNIANGSGPSGPGHPPWNSGGLGVGDDGGFHRGGDNGVFQPHDRIVNGR